MKKFISAVSFLLVFTAFASAQGPLYLTKQGKIHFFSDTKMEKIEATNKTVNAVLDATTGKMEWGVTIKGFQFEKALMQEHFNENYLESTKFPKATFKGKIDDLSKVDFKKDGTYQVKVSGDLTIHGVTKATTTDGQIIVKGSSLQLKSKFDVKYADYKIDIPSVVKENFTSSMAVDVDATLQQKQ